MGEATERRHRPIFRIYPRARAVMNTAFAYAQTHLTGETYQIRSDGEKTWKIRLHREIDGRITGIETAYRRGQPNSEVYTAGIVNGGETLSHVAPVPDWDKTWKLASTKPNNKAAEQYAIADRLLSLIMSLSNHPPFPQKSY